MIHNRIVLFFYIALSRVFSLKNILTMILFAIIGWKIRSLISGYTGLDLDTLIGFTATVLPAGIITRLASELANLLVNGSKQVIDGPTVTTELFSNSGNRSPSPTASGSNSSQTPQISGSQVARPIQEANQADRMAEVRERQAQYEQELERSKQIKKGERARINAADLQTFANSGTDVGYSVADPQGIGARGYIHQGVNQPYARALAEALKNQGVAGKTYYPKLDANAKTFLAQALPYIRPEVYGANPTASGNTSMIVVKTIRELEKMS